MSLSQVRLSLHQSPRHSESPIGTAWGISVLNLTTQVYEVWRVKVDGKSENTFGIQNENLKRKNEIVGDKEIALSGSRTERTTR